MLQLGLNFHDTLVEWRLIGLAGAVVAVVCLGLFEFVRPLHPVFKVLIGIALVAGLSAVTYTIIKLRGV